MDDENKKFKLEDIIEHVGVQGQPVLFWSDTIHCGEKYHTEESKPDESEPESEGVLEDESKQRIKRRKTEASGASRSNSSAESTSTMQWSLSNQSRPGSKS